MPEVLCRLPSSGNAMRRTLSLALSVALISSGCASADINDKLADGAESSSRGEPWFDRVKDWNSSIFSRTIEVKTDLPQDEAGSYEISVEICRAFTSQYDPNADEKPNLQIFGVQRETRTKVDGSTETFEDEVIIAQAVNITQYKCGANPPSKLRDEVRSLGVEVN